MKTYHLKSSEQESLQKWWEWLQSKPGHRARLRRAKSPDDILITEEFFHFLQRMPAKWAEPGRVQDSAMVAAALAKVESTNSKISFAQALATPPEGRSKAPVSELRFQQLQKSHSPEDFFRRLCRALALVKGQANVASLADSILHWNAEHRFGADKKPSKRLAVNWATDYYSALPKS